MISALLPNHRHEDVEAHVKVTSRPVTGEWGARICSTIDSARNDNTVHALWVDSIRTFHLFALHTGIRPGEAVTKVRWVWLTDLGEDFRVDVPGGNVLKWKSTPGTLIVPEHPAAPEVCPVANYDAGRTCA